jgi:hypothetical protein
MVLEATRNMMSGHGRAGDDMLARGAQPVSAQQGRSDEDSLFTCPDRDESGFVPSNR